MKPPVPSQGASSALRSPDDPCDTMGAFMDQRFLGRFRARSLVRLSRSFLPLVMCGFIPLGQAFTLTTTPSEAPAVQSQVVGQASLEDTLDEGDATALQLSAALSVHLRPTEPLTAFSRGVVRVSEGVLLLFASIWGLHTLRQWLLSMNRLGVRRHEPRAGIVEGAWPKLSVIVLAHNSQASVGEALEGLCHADYPRDQLQIVVVNDRSTDRTRQIIDEYEARHAGRIRPVHRNQGPTGRAACLLSAMPHVDGDFLLVLEAGHRMGPALIKQLMAPFFDPEVGSVTVRAMPLNGHANWMTRLHDMSQSALQQVDQQSRSSLGLIPHSGGLVAWRRSALVSACAASSDTMADEVDVAQRLSIRGWLQVHQGFVSAHVVIPQTWAGLLNRFMQHGRAQHRAAARHGLPLLASRHVSLIQKLDALMLHLQVFFPVLWVLAGGCVLALHLLQAAEATSLGLAVLVLAACSSLGHLAPCFQVMAAARMDGRRQALRLLPALCFLGVSGLMAHAALSMRLGWMAVRRVGPWVSMPAGQFRKPATQELANRSHVPGTRMGPETQVPAGSTWASNSEAA
jgi:Glycosyltransferase like family 2